MGITIIKSTLSSHFVILLCSLSHTQNSICRPNILRNITPRSQTATREPCVHRCCRATWRWGWQRVHENEFTEPLIPQLTVPCALCYCSLVIPVLGTGNAESLNPPHFLFIGESLPSASLSALTAFSPTGAALTRDLPYQLPSPLQLIFGVLMVR